MKSKGLFRMGLLSSNFPPNEDTTVRTDVSHSDLQNSGEQFSFLHKSEFSLIRIKTEKLKVSLTNHLTIPSKPDFCDEKSLLLLAGGCLCKGQASAAKMCCSS